MAGTGYLNAAMAALETTISTATSLSVTRDTRNVTPGCVLIEPPSGRALSPTVVDLTVPVKLISSGPANQDAVDQLLSLVAVLLAADVAVVDFSPSRYGDAEAPAYDLTVRLAAIA